MSRPPIVDVPRGVRSYRLETSRGSFAVLDTGAPRAGTALLVPGYTGSKEDFIALLEPLAARGYRVVAVDGRGQFETGGPRTGSAYSQAELAADVAAQTEALGGSAHLLGHSLGGHVARAAVLTAGAGPWRSLTLMSSGPAAIDASQRARTKLLVDALPVTDMATIWQAMRALDPDDVVSTKASAVPTAVDEFLYRRWMANVPEQLVATGVQLISEPDRVDELAALPLPKMVLSGGIDHVWPVAWLDAMAVRLSARRVVITGAEHSPNAERPHETATALADFWDDVRG